MILRLRRAMATRSVRSTVTASSLSTSLAQDTSCCWNNLKPSLAPSQSLSALAQVLADRLRKIDIRRAHDRHHHPASLRYLSLFGESPTGPWPQRPRLGVGRDARHHAETRSDGADRELSQGARAANRRRHLLRQSTDHARTGAPTSEPEFLSGRSRRSGCACVVGREDDVQPGSRYPFCQEARGVAKGVSGRSGQVFRTKYRSSRHVGRGALSARSAACASAVARSDDRRRALVLAGRGGWPCRPRGLPSHLVLAAEFRTGGSTARGISKAIELG